MSTNTLCWVGGVLGWVTMSAVTARSVFNAVRVYDLQTNGCYDRDQNAFWSVLCSVVLWPLLLVALLGRAFVLWRNPDPTGSTSSVRVAKPDKSRQK